MQCSAKNKHLKRHCLIDSKIRTCSNIGLHGISLRCSEHDIFDHIWPKYWQNHSACNVFQDQMHHVQSNIWVTFPSLHIEHKLVTFWESLSLFCDQILNGPIQTKNMFLHNFLGRVRICNHFLCRVIFKTPREIRI